MAHPRIGHRIRKYFEDHPGVTVYRDDLLDYIEKQTNNRPTDGGVVSAIKKLIEEGMNIKVVDLANSWRYSTIADRDSSKRSGEIFERVHITKGGAWILEDTKGEVTVVRVVDL